MKYGDVNRQEATATTNDVISFSDFNLADLYFKNASVGLNTTIYVVGITMTKGHKADLEVD